MNLHIKLKWLSIRVKSFIQDFDFRGVLLFCFIHVLFFLSLVFGFSLILTLFYFFIAVPVSFGFILKDDEREQAQDFKKLYIAWCKGAFLAFIFLPVFVVTPLGVIYMVIKIIVK